MRFRFGRSVLLTAVTALCLAGCDLLGGPGNRPPDPEILGPPDSARFLEEESFRLIGRATDPEDGVLGGRALRWGSHLDGAIGYGDTVQAEGLGPGRHRIRLIAEDRKEAADTASITVWIGDQPEPSDLPYRLEPVFEEVELERPTNLRVRSASGRWYVSEQRGRILTGRPGSPPLAPMLDIRDRVYLEEPHAEEGILGMALDPRFDTNGYLYLLYTRAGSEGREAYTADPTTGIRTVLARFRASGPGQADPASETVLLQADQPGRYHNGGQIAFGPEGYLHISIGDGGTSGDPAQATTNLLGSILRIDPRPGPEGSPYTIPADNPFASSSAAGRAEIFAWGFRNVWRFSIDPATGRIWAGDVGHTRYEELNLVKKGQNYGWNEREGRRCVRSADPCRTAGLRGPVRAYEHAWGASILAGHVSRSQRLEDLNGAYLYADYVSGRVWALEDADPSGDSRLIAQHPRPHRPAGQIAEIARGADGEIYFVSLDGSIYRLTKR